MSARDVLELLYLALSCISVGVSAYAAYHAKAAHGAVNGGPDSIKPVIDSIAADVKVAIDKLPEDNAPRS